MGDFDHLGAWLLSLSTLVAGRLSVEEIRLRISAYLPLLAEEFPNVEGYFTNQSLRHVARNSKWFPSYAELCDLLAAAHKDANPHLFAIAYDRPEGIPVEAPPYQLPPAPEWCFERSPRLFGKCGSDVEPVKPIRSVEQQLAILRGEKPE